MTFAVVLVLQCVAAGGFSWVVLSTTSSTLSAVTVCGRPCRAASFRTAAMPPSRNDFANEGLLGGDA